MKRFTCPMPLKLLSATLLMISVTLSSSIAGERVLYLGDSFSMGTFGRVLDQRMREEGNDVYTFVAGGASPYYWLKAYDPIPSSIGYWQKTPNRERRLGYIKAVPKVEDLMDDHEPTIVVVQTGVNLYAVLRSKRRPSDENQAEVRKVIDRMCEAINDKGALAYWILPPHSHERRYPRDLQMQLADIMRDVVKEHNGAVFESQQVTRFTANYPATDGIHYGTNQSKEWAERVAGDFKVYQKLKGAYAAKAQAANQTEIASVGTTPTLRAKPVVIATTDPNATVLGGSAESYGPPSAPSDLDAVAPDEEIELTLKLLEKSVLQDINGAPYNHALGVFEYEVVKDHYGNYPLKKVRVAHGILFNRRYTSSARREIGASIQMVMVPLNRYASLTSWQTVDDLTPNYDLPLYTPKLD